MLLHCNITTYNQNNSATLCSLISICISICVCNKIWYCTYHYKKWGRTLITSWNYKRYPIPRAIGCLLWICWEKIDRHKIELCRTSSSVLVHARPRKLQSSRVAVDMSLQKFIQFYAHCVNKYTRYVWPSSKMYMENSYKGQTHHVYPILSDNWATMSSNFGACEIIKKEHANIYEMKYSL